MSRDFLWAKQDVDRCLKTTDHDIASLVTKRARARTKAECSLVDGFSSAAPTLAPVEHNVPGALLCARHLERDEIELKRIVWSLRLEGPDDCLGELAPEAQQFLERYGDDLARRGFYAGKGDTNLDTIEVDHRFSEGSYRIGW